MAKIQRSKTQPEGVELVTDRMKMGTGPEPGPSSVFCEGSGSGSADIECGCCCMDYRFEEMVQVKLLQKLVSSYLYCLSYLEYTLGVSLWSLDNQLQSLMQCAEGHLFCFTCLRRRIEESTFGGAKASNLLPCMDTSGCEEFFPWSEV